MRIEMVVEIYDQNNIPLNVESDRFFNDCLTERILRIWASIRRSVTFDESKTLRPYD